MTAAGSATAREVRVTRRGGPEVLAVHEVEVPTPGDGEILVEVEAAGVAFGDLLLREGLSRRGRGPVVPGYDAAGTVTATGPHADSPAVGDRVAVWTGGSGGYRTHLVVPAWAAVPYPAHLSAAAVTSLVLNYLTAWQLLTRAAPIADGATVLVHSAAGGVGTALLQLAALRDLHVIGTASAGKAALVERLGATAIDYRGADVPGAVRAAAPDGVDVVLDPIGGRSWRQGLALLRPGGHLVVYGASAITAGGRRSLSGLVRSVAGAPRTSYLTYFRRSIGVTGYQSPLVVEAHHDWFRRDLAHLVGLLTGGAIDPVIHETYRLDHAADAHAELGAGRATGKIVLLAK